MEPTAPKTRVIPALPSELEAETRELYSSAMCGSDQVFRSVADPLTKMAEEPSFRRAYRCAAHEGFQQAQEHVVSRLQQSGTTHTSAVLALYRATLDSIAWTLLGRELYLARRFYLGQRPPDIKQSNFESVRAAASALRAHDHSTFPLFSDLTSFIQVGDLLVADVDRGMTIVEVKSGSTNSKVLEFAQFLATTPCERAVQFFRRSEGEATFQQLGRVMRQASRMEHVTEVVNTGSGVDPDEQMPVKIIESEAPLDDYDDDLAAVIDESRARGWALRHIDDCLFVAAYRDAFRAAGEYMFRTWFSECGGEDGFPLENLFATSMRTPLGLPIFCRSLPREAKFDLLFGRVAVYVALDMNGFIGLSNQNGLEIGWASRRETERLKKASKKQSKTGKPWTHRHRAIVNKNGSGALHDGLLTRIIHHGVTPRSAVQILKDYRDKLEPGS